MPSEATELAAEAAMSVSAAVWITLILFWIVSPIAGFYLFKVTRNRLPGSDTLALAAMAFCAFLVVFAISLLALQKFGGMESLTAFAISLIGALMVTGMCSAAVYTLLNRSRVRAKSKAEEHAFRVWDEDQRSKPKNLRRR